MDIDLFQCGMPTKFTIESNIFLTLVFLRILGAVKISYPKVYRLTPLIIYRVLYEHNTIIIIIIILCARHTWWMRFPYVRHDHSMHGSTEKGVWTVLCYIFVQIKTFHTKIFLFICARFKQMTCVNIVRKGPVNIHKKCTIYAVRPIYSSVHDYTRFMTEMFIRSFYSFDGGNYDWSLYDSTYTKYMSTTVLCMCLFLFLWM